MSRAAASSNTTSAQARAVERSVGRAVLGSERREHRGVARLPGRGQRMGEAVGVGDVDAERGERVRHRGLAAADAAGEADDERIGAHGMSQDA